MSRLRGPSSFLYPGDESVARQRAAAAAQARCDDIQAEARRAPGDRIRRGGLAPIAPLEPSADLLDRRLAQEIDYARRLLQAMGERLAGDGTVLARHATTLQAFDVVGQTLGYLSDVVGAADRDAAVDRIGMEDLRSRIRRRSLREETMVPSPEN